MRPERICILRRMPPQTATSVPLDDMLYLVLASDENGVQGLAVAASSALERASRPVHLWVIADGISLATQQRLRALGERSGRFAALDFAAAPPLPAWWAARNFPLVGYSRIGLDRILPESVQRCVYIDIDVLVGADLAELAAMPMHGYTVGMALNSGMTPGGVRYAEALGVPAASYYNSGVMLTDLAAWRAEGAREGLIAKRSEMPVDLSCYDQDVLNVYFQGRILTLAERWNRRDAAAPLEGNVLHFAGLPKPWKIADFRAAPSGLQAWKQALDQTGIEREDLSLWHRARRQATRLRVRAERLVRRRL